MTTRQRMHANLDYFLDAPVATLEQRVERMRLWLRFQMAVRAWNDERRKAGRDK